MFFSICKRITKVFKTMWDDYFICELFKSETKSTRAHHQILKLDVFYYFLSVKENVNCDLKLNENLYFAIQLYFIYRYSVFSDSHKKTRIAD